MSEAAPVVKPT
jgi:hypothetical protein